MEIWLLSGYRLIPFLGLLSVGILHASQTTVHIGATTEKTQSSPSRSIRTADKIQVLEEELNSSDRKLIIFTIENTLITYNKEFQPELVSSRLPELLAALHKKGVHVIALSEISATDQLVHSGESADKTYAKELQQAGVEIEQFFPTTKEPVICGDGITVHHGIIYPGKTSSKMKAIVAFIKEFKLSLSIDRVILVTDKIQYQFALLEEMVRENLSFLGLLYSEAKPFYSPLHMAAQRGNIAQARYLLLHGASVNTTTSSGETPLEIAIRFNQREMATFLLKQIELANQKSASQSPEKRS